MGRNIEVEVVNPYFDKLLKQDVIPRQRMHITEKRLLEIIESEEKNKIQLVEIVSIKGNQRR